MKNIISISELPHDEKVFLRKSFDGWRVVCPWKNSEGKINWFNFLTGGSWWKLIKLLFLLIIILGVSWSYARDTKECRDLISHPCDFYDEVAEFCTPQILSLDIQLPNFEEVVRNETNQSQPLFVFTEETA